MNNKLNASQVDVTVRCVSTDETEPRVISYQTAIQVVLVKLGLVRQKHGRTRKSTVFLLANVVSGQLSNFCAFPFPVGRLVNENGF